MTNPSPRLFIQSDDVFDPQQIAHWVELQMTDTLLDRIEHLSATLVRANLVALTTMVQAYWSLEPGWEIVDANTQMEVLELGLGFSCDARPIGTRLLMPSANRQVRATLLWGSIEEFVEQFRNNIDVLESSPTLAAWDDQKWNGEAIFTTNYQWFLRSVNAHLQQQNSPALRGLNARPA